MLLSRLSPRLAFGSIAVAALGLSLLGGSGLAVAANRPPAHVHPQDTPTPQPFPLVNGYADTYTFTESETINYPGSTPVPSTYTGSESDVYVCPVTFNGISNLCDDEEYDSTGFNGQLFFGYVPGPSGETQLVSYGTYDTYPRPPYVVNYAQYYLPDELYYLFPLTMGQTFNAADLTDQDVSTTYGPKNYSATTTGAQVPSGAYKYVTKVNDPAGHYKDDELEEVHANGSAKYTQKQTGYNALTDTFGTPVLRGSQEVVPVTTEGGNALPATPAPKLTTYVPDWFPGGKAAPKPLWDAPNDYVGVETLPSSCGAYGGTQAGDVQETFYTFDPLAGEYFTGESDFYVVLGVGLICEVDSAVDTYYDNLATGSVLYSVDYSDAYVLESQYIPDARTRKPGWPVALPNLQLRPPPNQEMADLLHRVRSARFGHDPHLGRVPRTPGERFADLRPT